MRTKAQTEAQADFMLRPLFDGLRIKAEDNLNEATREAYLERAARAIGCRDLAQFMVFQNREWVISQIPQAMKMGAAIRKDRVSGQFSMFDTFAQE